MLHLVVATGLKNVVETNEVALDVGIGIGDAVTHSCLSRQVDHNSNLVFCKDFLHGILVGNGGVDKGPVTL